MPTRSTTNPYDALFGPLEDVDDSPIEELAEEYESFGYKLAEDMAYIQAKLQSNDLSVANSGKGARAAATLQPEIIAVGTEAVDIMTAAAHLEDGPAIIVAPDRRALDEVLDQRKDTPILVVCLDTGADTSVQRLFEHVAVRRPEAPRLRIRTSGELNRHAPIILPSSKVFRPRCRVLVVGALPAILAETIRHNLRDTLSLEVVQTASPLPTKLSEFRIIVLIQQKAKLEQRVRTAAPDAILLSVFNVHALGEHWGTLNYLQQFVGNLA